MADDELRRIFAQNLVYYLQLNGYNQADLARHLHVSTATTAKWCTGQTMPRIDKIQSICNWLGIEKSSLLDDSTEEHDNQKAIYYTDPETARLAQEMFEDPEMRSLFHMKRNMEPEKFRAHYDMMKKMYQLEHPEDSDDYFGA